MKKVGVILVLITLYMALAQHAMAGDRYYVYVYDKDGRLTSDALVEIWISGDKTESGYTDSDGRYECWLDINTRYRITARKYNQFNEWIDYPNINDRKISIHMY